MSILSPTQRYATGGLLVLALHQVQIHQTRRFGSSISADEVLSEEDSVAADTTLWIHHNSGLLRHVFRSLDVDPKAWNGLEETAGPSPERHHVEAFLKLLSEDSEPSQERMDQEMALTKAVDAMSHNIESTKVSHEASREISDEYENECREKLSTSETESISEMEGASSGTVQAKSPTTYLREPDSSGRKFGEEPAEGHALLSSERKLAVLFELLSACLSNTSKDDEKTSQARKGYDARYRVALRLLATWLDVKWNKVEAMEVIVACSAMAIEEEKECKKENKSKESSWASWKQGGIIGAAALTGGTLMAITGGLAAPAIAAGFSALAPTLGALVPAIGAGGFAAAATATGSVAGSVAVAASLGVKLFWLNCSISLGSCWFATAAGAGLTGSKMARRIADIEEFEFKTIGENHNQGRLAVGIMISGLVFEEEDFWETENLIAVGHAVQDWLTSKIAVELMKKGVMTTVFSTLLAALAWPATVLTAADIIDNKWAIALDRSDKAGKLLAEALLGGLQGNRPVTLIGFSLGARLIFKCLECLAENGDDGVGLVERVVLLGAPLSIKNENWESARKMVAGRFVNAYSTSDWTLGITFRASLLSQGLAGIQHVDVPGIESVDVTEIVEGHSSYLWTTQKILKQLELDTYFPIFKQTEFGSNVAYDHTVHHDRKLVLAEIQEVLSTAPALSQGRTPLCVGVSRTLQQGMIGDKVPSYIGESEMEASKEGRTLSDFKYACVGYSVHLNNKDSPTDPKEKEAELPFCVGIELLVDKRATNPDHAHAPARAHNREDNTSRHTPLGRNSSAGKFTRNAGLVAGGVVRNMNRVGIYIKENLDDILYPYRRRPK
ncbi:hypothetical protein Sjap_017010 [Stephania japonica]|uniref:DUF8204 domain-containing protein n=1 Tax=Stephania japonica TaxID=461633 RepID=A0AAP0I5C2_9MAGN